MTESLNWSILTRSSAFKVELLVSCITGNHKGGIMSLDINEIEEEVVGKNFYINPEEMRKEWDACMKRDECSKKLLGMFELIARHFSRNFMYINNTDKEACINFALTEAWQKWKRFDPTITDNIFALFTTMISNDMRQHFKHITKNYSRNISIEALMTSVKNK